jgi:RimJ/RimL family protein N-acetyltransferase
MPDFESFTTSRLRLRRPRVEDAPAIFRAYASDPTVTRYLAWPRHRNVADSRAFVEFADAEWAAWPVGPYLIEELETGGIIGSTGLAFETPDRASTGYVLAQREWGKGLASEALAGVLAQAERAGVGRITALCHVDHRNSRRVLEKAGFEREGILRRHTVFPNLEDGTARDVALYARILRG